MLIISFLLAASAYAEGDAAGGKTRSAMCAACHGAEGISKCSMAEPCRPEICLPGKATEGLKGRNT